MALPKIFFSFHYEKDVFRVQQIRNMGIVEGNKEMEENKWMELRRKVDHNNIKKWIIKQIEWADACIFLIGEETSQLDWCKYEFKTASANNKKMLEVKIHNLVCAKTGQKAQEGEYLSANCSNIGIWGNKLETYNPSISNTYDDIKKKIQEFVGDL